LGAGDIYEVTVRGSNGECTGGLAIPSDAVAVALNVTAVNATASSNIRLYPANLTSVPLLSNLNVTAGAPATPNKVDVKLSPDGKIRVFNFNGSVNIILDVVGYYTNSTLQELSAGLAAANAKIASLETGVATNMSGVAANAAGVAALDAAQPFTVVSPATFSVTAESTQTPTNIRSVTVTAPVGVAGQVATIATGYMTEDTDGESVLCGVMDSETSPRSGERLIWQSPTGGDFAHLSGSRVFDIAAGEKATYYLVCRSSSGTSAILSPRLTAIFTPAP